MHATQAVENKYYWGIDPGSLVMGYAILNNQGKLVSMGTLTLRGTDAEKYKAIFHFMNQMFAEFPPIKIGIESPFYGKNIQSMLTLARAQMVVITSAALADVAYEEYAPRLVKQWVTGSGNATKEAVAEILKRKFSLQTMPTKKDASDALAVAFCTWLNRLENKIEKMQKFNNWGEFVNKKNKIIKKNT
jgi:crossover junction endodeoxyribonuclease RuvC